MELTWKKWFVFLLIAAVALIGAQFYAESRLVRLIYGPPHPLVEMEGISGFREAVRRGQLDEYVPLALIDRVQAPWPDLEVFGEAGLGEFDPDRPATQDAETIMGLALLGPPADRQFRERLGGGSDVAAFADYGEAWFRWFLRLSDLAIGWADDETKPKLRRVVLAVMAGMPEAMMGEHLVSTQPTATAPQTQPSVRQRFLDHLVSQAEVLAPQSALLAYLRADQLLTGAVAGKPAVAEPAPVRPTEQMERLYGLAPQVDPVQVARRIDEVLGQMRDGESLFDGYRRELLVKGAQYRWPNSPMPLAFARWRDHSTLLLSSLPRQMVFRLCFLGDRLGEMGESQSALAIYEHAYRIAWGLTSGRHDGSAVSFAVGIGGVSLLADHLVEFWCARGDVGKAMAAREFDEQVDWTCRIYQREIERNAMDPLGVDQAGYVAYVRAAGLTWWLGLTGLLLAAVSLVSAGIHLVLLRERWMVSVELGVPPSMLYLATALPAFLMIWLVMVMPFSIDRLIEAGLIMGWACLWSSAIVVVLGLVSRWSAFHASEVRASPAGWIWLVAALAILLSCVLAGVMEPKRMSTTAFALSAAALTTGLLVWLLGTLIAWVFRSGRTFERHRYRAATTKAFSVCTMAGAALFLALALGSMPLTAWQQNRYYREASEAMDRGVERYFPSGLPAEPLESRVFRANTTAAPTNR